MHAARPEFQVVILAGGSSHRMMPLTQRMPKALLPIANQTLLGIQLRLVRKAGFSEAIVVTTDDHYKAISAFLEDEVMDMAIDLVAVDNDKGSADALRAIRDKLRTDFMVISGDLVSEVPIHNLADVHRISNATVTMLLKEEVTKLDPRDAKAAKGAKGKLVDPRPKRDDDQVDIFGIATGGGEMSGGDFGDFGDFGGGTVDSDAKRVVLMTNKMVLDDELRVSRTLLRRVPSLAVHTDLLDTHFYIFAHWVLDLLDVKKRITSIKGELVPHLVRRQFRGRDAVPPEVLSRALPSELSMLPHTMSHAISSVGARPQIETNMGAEGAMGASAAGATDAAADAATAFMGDSAVEDAIDEDVVRCCAYVLPVEPSYCQRANSVAAFKAMNRDIATRPVGHDTPWKAQAPSKEFHGCVLQLSTQLEPQTKLQGCVIGKDCYIGKGARLNQCVLMDNVVVEEGCVVQNSVLCEHCVIGKGCNLNDCTVGWATVVAEGGKHKKEELSSRTLDDDSMESGGDMTESNTSAAAALAAVNAAAAPARARMGSMRTLRDVFDELRLKTTHEQRLALGKRVAKMFKPNSTPCATRPMRIVANEKGAIVPVLLYSLDEVQRIKEQLAEDGNVQPSST